MRPRLSVALLAVALGTNALYALDPSRTLTQYVHRIWQTQQGLPESSIYSILQAHDGYLWLGTLTGVVRFDGVRFTTIDEIYPKAVAAGLGTAWIRSMVEDDHGALWIGTNESGLFRLENGEIKHYSQKEGLPSDSVQCLAAQKDSSGEHLWVCTASGLARIDDASRENASDDNAPRDAKIKVFRREDGLSTNDVRAVAIGPKGQLWVGGDNAWLQMWNGSRFEARQLTSISADSGVRGLEWMDNALWIGTTTGVIQMTGADSGFGAEHFFTTKQGLAGNWVLALSASRDGSLWIGTRNGFSRLRDESTGVEIDSFRPQDGLSQSTVFCVFEDREGSLWIGTKHGLNQFLEGRAVPYTVNEGLPTNETGPVIEDHSGKMWIGTLGAGLARFEGRRFASLTKRDGLASDVIDTLAQDSDGTLWAGTDRGLNRLRDGRVERTFTRADGLPSDAITSLYEDESGTLWVGTSAGAATMKNGKIAAVPGFDLRAPVLAIGEDGARRIYLATATDTYVYESGKSEELTQGSAPMRGVDAFYRDPQGRLWIGMLGSGLRMIENGKISYFLMRDGLFDGEIYGLVADAQGRLWMACSKGIFSVPLDDLRRFAAGEIKKFVSTPYSPTDAQRVIECKSGVQPAASASVDGRLWFSTIRGLIVLDPLHLQRNTPPPAVVIEAVTVNGERESPEQIGALAPGRKNIEVLYTGLSFLAPGRITFRYMLEGFDKEWINAGTRREAYYTNLPPGTFHFRVTACNSDGACNETGSLATFQLASHYYQRIWFWPLCVVALAMAIWLAYQLRIRRLQEQFGLILNERNRIARELHDTLIQGLSGITMEMQALAGRMRAPDERGVMDDIIKDAGTCLRETRRSVAGLRSGQNAGLARAIEQAARQLTETKPIKLKLKLGKDGRGLPADVEYNLVRIAQEAVTNSVKHSGARTVEVALDFEPKAVLLRVKDDGAGFAREENGHGRTGHYGLIGMKERASHIGAEFDLASAPGRGTVVSVKLPAWQNGGAQNGFGQNGKHASNGN